MLKGVNAFLSFSCLTDLNFGLESIHVMSLRIYEFREDHALKVVVYLIV